ncbi:MAG: glucose-6-phosphate dehydrogenase [bacterium]|nr:glucose-6-phosphate dehydrogenase [bacterium]
MPNTLSPISQPVTIFLIGATGDLAKKKILKAMYVLFEQSLLATQFTIIGNARKEYNDQTFRAFVKEVVKPSSEAVWSDFAQHLFYWQGDASMAESFTDLSKKYDELPSTAKTPNHLWYLATLPKLYEAVISNLQGSNLLQQASGWTKIMLEKPFGTDLATSRALNQTLTSAFPEEHIYRLDHFLGKETVQNILAFRFANGIFEHLWKSEYIDHIQVTASETLGISGRGQFYDETGTVRDVVQNHVLQMLAVAMMEEPASLEPEVIRKHRSAFLHSLIPLTTEELSTQAAFGQYQSGQIDGEVSKSYQDESDVAPLSSTETAVAFKAYSSAPRWKDVPIYIRAGKRLATSVTEISFYFREPSNRIFSQDVSQNTPNVLTFRIQPSEGIVLKLMVKKPGLSMILNEVPMSFRYHNQFQMDLVEAYIKLIYDAVKADPSLFPQADEIDAAWEFIQPLLDHLQQPAFRPEAYTAGTWGPESFDKLIQGDGRTWLEPEKTA